MAAVTAIAAVGLAVSIGTTANSFAQASKQKKAAQQAEIDADKAMGSLNCHFIQAKSVVPFFPLLNLKFHGRTDSAACERLSFESASPPI